MPAKYARATFTIQNQNSYDPTGAIKQLLLTRLKSEYNLVEYLICQEINTKDKVQKDYVDTHLQGILIFNKSGISEKKLIKFLEGYYKPQGQESIGRVHVEQLKKVGAMQNYFTKEGTKEGMDLFPLSNMMSLEKREDIAFLDKALRQLISDTISLQRNLKLI